MTSSIMRTDPLFLRNSFTVTGKWDIPIIKKQDIPLDNVRLIAYSDTKQNDRPENTSCGVHFFIDDYQFERLWRFPDRYIPLLQEYDCVLTPDFSIYVDMPLTRLIKSKNSRLSHLVFRIFVFLQHEREVMAICRRGGRPIGGYHFSFTFFREYGCSMI